MEKDRDSVLKKLIEIQYNRNDMNFIRGTFRVRGDVLEIFPAGASNVAYRVEFFGDEIDRITEIDTLTGEVLGFRNHITVFPASHYVTSKEKLMLAREYDLAGVAFWEKDRETEDVWSLVNEIIFNR